MRRVGEKPPKGQGVANRYCSNCGQELSEGGRFCPGCGRPVYDNIQVPTPEADAPVPPGDYLVEPAKPWYKTRLTAEGWFLRNPPHVWRTLDAAVEHYMASGFELLTRTPRIEAELTGRGHAILNAKSRYTPRRYILHTVVPWTILTLGVALPIFIWHYMAKSMNERYPGITIEPNPDGSGTFLESRQKTGSMLIGGEPMVHPETGEIGWTGLPDQYIENVVNTLRRQAGG